MDMSSFSSSILFLSYLLFHLTFLPKFSLSDPRATEAGLICSNRTAATTERSSFISNFLSALDTLSPQIAFQQYSAVINGTGNSTVYAFGECMKDLDGTDCNLCFAQCKTQILRCLPFQKATRGGRLFYDGCYIRYDDYDFFSEAVSEKDTTVCGTDEYGGNKTLFEESVSVLVKNLSVLALNNDNFYVGNVLRGNVSVYGLAQCWEGVNRTGCEECLNKAVSNITSCAPKQEGRALNAGCFLRYSTEKFYNNSGPPSLGNEGRGNLGIVLAVVSSALAFGLVAAAAVFFVRKRFSEKAKHRKELGALLATVNNSKLNFTYESLESATNYFHLSNKLGQGGSGSVYKGVLPDGKVVAIKRLFFNTRQWVDHFFNEVNLISNMEHKNLVKLLGCSITGPESLLVYEYAPNQSLHDHMFVKKSVEPLPWEARYKILLGTAEGLAYLHEESDVRIIHRDIKLSNILLDGDLTPKIADFGLARLFPEDKTHISTAIAGTLGYMAPEYIVRGKLTEKADVYSYGVLIIEVVTGRRTSAFSQSSCSILQTVWNLYRKSTLSEVVDPTLGGNFPEAEASRMLQVGLLCVQAFAEQRPSMSFVVKLLSEESYEIPQPTQPPFLHPSSSAETSRTLQPPSYSSRPESNSQSSGNSLTQSWIEPR